LTNGRHDGRIIGIATTTARSFCRLCPAYCGLVVTLDGDRVVKVLGDRDHPVSQGYTCPKGRALGELHHHPQRLDGPLLRRNGTLEPVGWDELLDDLATKLRPILDEHGPAAIGAYFGTAAVFDANLYWAGARFLRQLGSPSKFTSGTIDAPSYPVVRRLMAGVGWLFHSIDFEETTLLLLLGTNPVVSHNSHMQAFPNPTARIREIVRRGEVWVVDARLTETARLATRHVPARPGSDYALLAFLIRELLREGADEEWLVEHGSRVDELRAAVEPYDEATAARITGLEPDVLTDLLAAIRRHGRLSLQTGTGTSMSPAGNLTAWLSMALLAVTGSLERPGGVWFNPGFVQGLDTRPGKPDPEPEPGPPSRPELPRQGGEYPSITMVDEMEAGNLKAMFVLGGNLVVALPDSNRVKEAFRKTPVVVVSDVQHGDMTELATHVFAAAGPLERADLPHFSDCLAPTLAAQYTHAVVPLTADRKPAWWPLAALAERLGLSLLPEPLTLDTATDDDLLRMRIRPGSARATFDELKAAPTALVDEDRSLGWVERNILPEGRWNLAPEPLVEQLAAVEEPAPLVLIPRRLWRRVNSYARDLPSVLEHEPANVLLHPADAADAGVADGDPVQVESAFGRLTGTAKVDGTIRRGAVAIPHGLAEPNVSVLLSGREKVDPLTGMPTYSGVPVTLSAA
jgi:anaerobic selenocysteine-containing dehydrogenase